MCNNDTNIENKANDLNNGGYRKNTYRRTGSGSNTSNDRLVVKQKQFANQDRDYNAYTHDQPQQMD
jgi:hypothetical protein